MTSPTDLAALLCSRLCHDLLSPVGAINNGLELLAEEKEPTMRQRCFELLEQSAQVSALKLKYFRLAYGAAGGFGDRVPAEEPRELLEALTGADDRVKLAWAVAEPTMGKPAVKTLLNLAAIALDALVRGGTLEVGAETRDGATEIVVRGTGPRIAFDNTIGDALTGKLPTEDLSPRTAPAYMIRLLVEERGGQVQFARTDDAIVLGAMLPDTSELIG